MAEAFLGGMARDRFEALSAGIAPRGLHPLAVEVMREFDIDISQQRTKDVCEFLGSPISYIATICDNAKELPFPGTYKDIDWSFEDPAADQAGEEQKLTVFRRVRDEVASRIEREFVMTIEAAGLESLNKR